MQILPGTDARMQKKKRKGIATLLILSSNFNNITYDYIISHISNLWNIYHIDVQICPISLWLLTFIYILLCMRSSLDKDPLGFHWLRFISNSQQCKRHASKGFRLRVSNHQLWQAWLHEESCRITWDVLACLVTGKYMKIIENQLETGKLDAEDTYTRNKKLGDVRGKKQIDHPWPLPTPVPLKAPSENHEIRKRRGGHRLTPNLIHQKCHRRSNDRPCQIGVHLLTLHHSISSSCHRWLWIQNSNQGFMVAACCWINHRCIGGTSGWRQFRALTKNHLSK